MEISLHTYLVNLDQYNTVFPSKTRVEPIKLDTSYQFYRFFSNGRMYVSYILDHFPTIEEQNNYNLGMIGYYKITNKNEIITEVYVSFDSGKYSIDYGIIKGDSIIFNYTKSNVFFGLTKEKTNIRLHKVRNHKVFLYSEADW